MGIPCITNSTPWADQAQLELVAHEKTGLHASTPETMSEALLELSQNTKKRIDFGNEAKARIHQISNPQTSLLKLEKMIEAVVQELSNPFQKIDYETTQQIHQNLLLTEMGQKEQEIHLLNSLYKQLSNRKLNSSTQGIPAWLIPAR